MAQFTTLRSRVIPLDARDVDTDQIIPARFLKITDKEGLAEKLFHDWRYLPDGSEDPEFITNKPACRNAQILLAGDNFGCGSSREHAPWALYAFGIRAILSTSFADIFKNNALKNGLLPVELPPEEITATFKARQDREDIEVSVDLEHQTVSLPTGKHVRFEVDGFAKHCLLNGIDQLGYLQSFEAQIQDYEQRTDKNL
ncbi:MAG: 3-isopropylmalate dehydratase small subunit [Myxococcota bacterium]